MSSSRKEFHDEADGLSHLSSDAQTMLADLATDKATRKYVLLMNDGALGEDTEVPSIEADIIPSEQTELNSMVFDAFTSDEIDTQKYNDTFDETGRSDIVDKDTILINESDIPDRGGDQLMSLMTDVEVDYADTASASGDLSSLFRDIQDALPDFATRSDEDEEVGNNTHGADNNFSPVSHLEQLKLRLAAGINKIKVGQASGVANSDAPDVVRKIFEAETSSSPILKTAVFAFVLLLVAALPPILNLNYIQPTISENNRKADEIKIFQGQIAQNNRRSGDLLSQIKLLEKRSENIAGTLVDRERFEFLLQRFLAEFERFGVEIISVNNDVDAESKFIVGNNLPVLVNTVTVQLESRFEIYQSLRKEFIDEIKNVAIIEESLIANQDTNLLNISLKMAIALKGKE
jgi:hypothetical protein